MARIASGRGTLTGWTTPFTRPACLRIRWTAPMSSAIKPRERPPRPPRPLPGMLKRCTSSRLPADACGRVRVPCARTRNAAVRPAAARISPDLQYRSDVAAAGPPRHDRKRVAASASRLRVDVLLRRLSSGPLTGRDPDGNFKLMYQARIPRFGALAALLALALAVAAPGMHAFAHISHDAASHSDAREAGVAGHDQAASSDHDHGSVHPEVLHRVAASALRAPVLIAALPSSEVRILAGRTTWEKPVFAPAQRVCSRAPPPGDPARAPPV